MAMKTRNDLLLQYKKETGMDTDRILAGIDLEWYIDPSLEAETQEELETVVQDIQHALHPMYDYLRWLEEKLFIHFSSTKEEQEKETREHHQKLMQENFIFHVKHLMTREEIDAFSTRYQKFLYQIPSTKYGEFLVNFENHSMDEMIILYGKRN